MSIEFYLTAVALTTVVSISRLTRLATWDLFPPIRWARDKYADWTDGSGWQLLAFCGYCASFWVAVAVVLWGYFAGVYSGPGVDLNGQIWWAVNGVLASSYLAAILMAHDGDEGEED